MPGLYFRCSRFKLDSGGFTKKLDLAIRTQMTKAAKRFVEAALYEGIRGGVPVDTGMAAGSYLNISRMLDIVLSITPKSDKIKRYYGDNAKGQIKSPELGASLSTQFRSKDTIIKKRGNLYYFEFESDVFHYTLLDQIGIAKNPNSPWNTFQTGRDAFMEYMRVYGVKRLPKVSSYLERTQIEVNPSGGITETRIASNDINTVTDNDEEL